VPNSLTRIALATAIVATSASAQHPAWRTRSARAPHFVVIRTDDQDLAHTLDVLRPDTGEFLLEHVKKIARQGIDFTRCVTSYPLCAPSRASFLTGQYAHNHRVLSNDAPDGGYAALDHANTLAVWLQRAGYRTAHCGKYLNGYGAAHGVPPGWDEMFTFLDPRRFFDYLVFTDDRGILAYGSLPEDYSTDVLTAEAVSFLRKQASGEQPLFLLVDYAGPHVGTGGSGQFAVPAPRHQGLFAGFEPDFPPSFNEADVADKPRYVRSNPPFPPAQVDGFKKAIRLRLEALASIDEGVGAILEALEETGLLEDTVVIFTSDNGYQLGEHRIRASKGWVYEESIHVPLIVRGPGLPRGVSVDALVSNVDLAPTIVELSGAAPGLAMDGRSLVPLIRDPGLRWYRELLLEGAEDPFGKTFCALLDEDHLYVELEYALFPDVPGPDEIELYLRTPDACGSAGDPFQLQSQHKNACYASLLSTLRDRLAELKTCSGTACR